MRDMWDIFVTGVVVAIILGYVIYCVYCWVKVLKKYSSAPYDEDCEPLNPYDPDREDKAV